MSSETEPDSKGAGIKQKDERHQIDLNCRVFITMSDPSHNTRSHLTYHKSTDKSNFNNLEINETAIN